MNVDERLACVDPERGRSHERDRALLVRIVATRPARRRGLMLLLAALLLVAATVPTAVALRTRVLDFATAEPAPGRVVRSFATVDRDVGGLIPRPGLIAEETRKVLELDGGRVALWVAPTRSGDFCWQLEDRRTGHGSGGCGRRIGGRMHARVPLGRRGSVRFAAVEARLRDPRIARLTVRHEDGAVVDVPIVWVSDPIGVGFAVYVLPPERWRPGLRPVEAIAYDRDGDMVKRERLKHRLN